jgi:hypothetical protein
VLHNDESSVGREFRDRYNHEGCPTTQPLTAVASPEPDRVTIHVVSFMMQYPFGQVGYNSGSITPVLNATTYYVYCDDPNHRGGVQTYLVTTKESDLFATEGRVYVGAIITPGIGNSGSSTLDRESHIRPLLDRKGWSTHHTVYDYLKGDTDPYPSTRAKMAKSLGIDVTELPR